MHIIDLGLTDFLDAYQTQLDLLKKVSRGLAEDTLFITEHRPVITIGRRGRRDNILKSEKFLSSRGIGTVCVDRGGDVTYHGPGQIIAYPIFRLENESRDIHGFMDLLEDIGSDFLEQYGFACEKRPGLRGVWADGKKVGSIGIGVKKWVTYHGLALNVNTDLTPFSFIRPCGIEGVKVGSLEELLGRRLDINDAKDRLISSFEKISLLAEAVAEA